MLRIATRPATALLFLLPSLLLVLVLALAPTPALAGLGGDPGDLIYVPSGVDFLSFHAPRLLVSASGSLFALTNVEDAVNDGIIVVLRSDDGGRTWREWSVLQDPGGEPIREPAAALIQEPGGEYLVVGYQVDGPPDSVWVQRAATSDAVGAWIDREVEEIPWSAGVYPYVHAQTMAARSSASGPATVAVAYLVATDFNDFELRYSVSLDGGQTFQPPLLLVDLAPEPDGVLWPELELGFGAGGTVHLVALRRHYAGTTDYTRINHLTAQNEGATFADWNFPSTLVMDDPYGYFSRLTLASDPAGDDLLLGYTWYNGSAYESAMLGSLDGGATWTPTGLGGGQVLGNLDLAWTPLGPLGAASDATGHHLVRGTGGLLDPYEAEHFLRAHTAPTQPAAVVIDPTRGDQAAIVGGLTYDLGFPQALWFDAEWRDQPGYAVDQTPWQRELAGTDEHYVGAPAVADLDGDGLAEIVIASDAGLLYRYAGGSPAQATYDLGAAGPASVPALCDLDGDGDLEIAVGGADGRLHVLDHALQPLAGWPVDLGSASEVFVSAGPVTGTLPGEVVAVTGNTVHVLDAAGSPAPGWPRPIAGAQAAGRAALGDIDDDGAVEVVAALGGGVVLLGPDATVEGIRLVASAAPAAGASLSDLDGDGDLELAVPLSDGTVALIHHDGTTVGPNWPYDTGTGSPVLGVTLAAVLNPTTPALAFATASGSVFATAADGTDLPGFPVSLAPGDTAASEPIIARTARPGVERPQLLVGSNEGWLWQWTAQGEAPADWPNAFARDPLLAPAVADADGDGVAEIVLAAGHRLHVLDTGTAPLALPLRQWPMTGRDLGRTGSTAPLPAPTAVADPAPHQGTRVSFAGAHPNPAPGRATFRFTLPAAGAAELAIYDVRGRRVRGFARQDLPAGPHALDWNGRDDRGASVASGVYLARLVVRGEAGQAAAVLTRSVVVRR